MAPPVTTAPAAKTHTGTLTDALARGGRLVSLDAFRGLTIAAMILVNNPGTWAAVYPPLVHADWHGWTPTDLVFPFFLFIVGVAVAFAYQKRLARGADRGPLLRKALRRTAILFGLGLLLAAFPFFHTEPSFGFMELSTLRIPGVLQRIAVCYLAVTLLFLYAKPRTEYVVAAVILLGYWAAMVLVPVPGYGAGVIDQPDATLAAYLDRLLVGTGHLWEGAGRMWDPEGVLSTFPAIVTTLLGVWTGRLLLSERAPLEKVARLFVWGVALVAAGYVWDWFFPINKKIWTSSYVLFTGGQAMCALGVCYWVADVRGLQRWAKPFVEYGVNAITVYVLSGLLAVTLYTIPAGETSLQGWIFAHVYLPLGPPAFASLLYALTWVLALYGVAHVMYRRGVIVKV